MPFATEELWQRLPHTKGTSDRRESIMISEYPSVVEAWTNEQIESDMEIVNGAVSKLRTLRQQNDINERCAAFGLCGADDVAHIIRTYKFEIVTLASLSSLKVLSKDDTVPVGCAFDVVYERLSMYLQL